MTPALVPLDEFQIAGLLREFVMKQLPNQPSWYADFGFYSVLTCSPSFFLS
jgi:hypothetical protein